MFALALTVSAWIFFDTRRALSWLSWQARTSFTNRELAFFKINAAIVALGTAAALVVGLLSRL